MILPLAFLSLLICLPAPINSFEQLVYENLSNEVKTHLQQVVSEKYTRLYNDMYQNCNAARRPQVVIHLHISQDSTPSEDSVVWEADKAPCSIRLFSTTDKVLQDWCQAAPHSFMNYPYNHTDANAWAIDPNFVTVVQTTCHRFQGEPGAEELPRVPHFTPPFNQNNTKKISTTLVIAVLLAVAVIFLITSLYCHRYVVKNRTKACWSKYWEQKEWHQINEIVEHREKLINEIQEKKMVENMA
ncbi:hypothetical protein CRE_22813 [Caenorhabditis remanei]|uniref:Uncharacterized protein n=1 Tax=Caenorhabditis remanei TaxID=31234 RepID=E3MHD4_CAERE|nr:hypothetical protein CRE_22813 [Caenorhabditis remanei]